MESQGSDFLFRRNCQTDILPRDNSTPVNFVCKRGCSLSRKVIFSISIENESIYNTDYNYFILIEDNQKSSKINGKFRL